MSVLDGVTRALMEAASAQHGRHAATTQSVQHRKTYTATSIYESAESRTVKRVRRRENAVRPRLAKWDCVAPTYFATRAYPVRAKTHATVQAPTHARTTDALNVRATLLAQPMPPAPSVAMADFVSQT